MVLTRGPYIGPRRPWGVPIKRARIAHLPSRSVSTPVMWAIGGKPEPEPPVEPVIYPQKGKPGRIVPWTWGEALRL